MRRLLGIALVSLAVSFPLAGAHAASKKIVIGVSNGYFGTDWRTQMYEDMEKTFNFYKGKGLATEMIVQHAGADINQQIQQCRNMINQGVTVLMINANSATGLNGVINEAKAAGIPVVSFDQAVTNPYAINVTNDHYSWATSLAEWLAKSLNGKGKVIMLDGLPGHPAAEARKKAAEDVFKKYPGIEILKEEYGWWDNAKAQSIMNDLLAAYPQIDGVFVEDSMATGVYNAFVAAKRPLPVMTGDPMLGFFKEWDKQIKSGNDFQAMAQANPPGVSATALGIAVYIANGKKLKPLKDNTFYIPITVKVTKDNLADTLERMKGSRDTQFLDEWLDDDQVKKLFQ